MKSLEIAVLLAVLLGLFGVMGAAQALISGSVDTLQYMKAPPYKIGLDIYWLGNSWSVQFAEEAKYEASLHSDVISELYITDSEGKVEKQVANLEALIAKEPDIILICPLSQTALIPPLKKAKEKGIPVIFYGGFARTKEVEELITAEISVDDVLWGRLSAEWLVDKLSGKGSIIALSGLAGCDVAEDRWEGATSVFRKYPDIKILAHEYADWSYPKAKAVMSTLLPAFPEIDGIWSDGAATALGVIDALKEAGRPIPPLIGEDYNGFLKVWIKEGFDTIIMAKPTYIGSESILVALKVLRGEAVPKHIDLTPPMITSTEQAKKFVHWGLSDEAWCRTRLPEEKLKELFGG